MAEVIDMGTRKRIDPGRELEMIKDWAAFSDKHIGEAACCIYYDKHSGLSFISTQQSVMIALIVSSYKMLVGKGLIESESGKTGSGFFRKLRGKLLSMLSFG